jgi:integrase
MPKISDPYRIEKRKGYATYMITLSATSGLPYQVYTAWQRKSFKNFPDTLAIYRYPRNLGEAKRGALALIQFLKKQPEPPEPNPAVSNRTKPATDIPLVQYIADFWTPNSRYAKEKTLVKGKALSAVYIKLNHDDVARHIKSFPPFQDLRLGDLTSGLIRDWMIWMAERGASGRRINSVLQTIRVAVKDLADREDLDFNPFRRVKPAQENLREKGILAAVEVSRLIRAPVKSSAARLAVLLGALCGMRRGEIRDLQWGDIQDGYIDLCHNWQDMEGMKSPKWGSNRTVPILSPVASALAEVRRGCLSGERFVLVSPACPDSPVSNNFFRYALTRELEAIGIPAEGQKRRNITFHSLRHTFVTLCRLAGISDLEIQALAGHKDASMMNRYSHAGQVLDFAITRGKMEAAILQ